MSAIDRFLGSLSKVRRTGNGQWIACCPAHEDKSPSLTIKHEADDTVLMHCFAGCSVDAIVGAVGMELHEFFPEREKDSLRKPARVPFNSRDVLACIKNDATLLCVVMSDVRQGKTLTPDEINNAYKAACRIVAAAEMGGA